MEKEKIFSELKSKIGETSLSDRTIMSVVESYASDEGFEPDDAWWSKQVTLLQSLQGQYNHDLAEGLKAKETVPSEPKEPKEPKNGTAPTISDELREMLEQIKQENKELRERIDEADAAHSRRELLHEVREAMTAEGCDREYVLSNVLRNAKIDVTKKASEIVADLLPIYDKEVTEAFGAGVPPRNGGAGAGDAKTAADAYFERKWKQQESIS